MTTFSVWAPAAVPMLCGGWGMPADASGEPAAPASGPARVAATHTASPAAAIARAALDGFRDPGLI